MIPLLCIGTPRLWEIFLVSSVASGCHEQSVTTLVYEF